MDKQIKTLQDRLDTLYGDKSYFLRVNALEDKSRIVLTCVLHGDKYLMTMVPTPKNAEQWQALENQFSAIIKATLGQ